MKFKSAYKLHLYSGSKSRLKGTRELKIAFFSKAMVWDYNEMASHASYTLDN